ncbi:late control gene D protein (GPD) [Aquimarina sp. MAR_2010_214]|uniref:type VI secretion system Vgr family protein n=1 Tax=Aquimarina sp. MAR_2010_214 TaxID=1250026 RepID=UPI000CBBCDE0|nr:phage baseplate assembly protein V [Aquimarina sp. MAR_2010_214]PKV50750.1 late control gene D protein (GPD) [Aquimarina sp. MAR_2010_214]
MALQSNIQIFIGGTLIPTYKRLMLRQDLDSHHILELVCRMDVLEKLGGEMASESKNFLGEIITLQVSSSQGFSGYGELEFKGVVIKVNNTKGFDNGEEDTVEIKAQSASIIADDGPHFTSHNDVGLAEILNKTFQGYDQSKLETSFNPTVTSNIHYSVQHNDSAYQYASRLAAQYSEWFYYDGKALIFGKPKDSEEVILTYGHDLKKFTLELNPTPNNFKYFTNDYLTDGLHEKTTTGVNSGVNGYNSFTSNKSEEIYAKETSVYLNSYNDPELKQRFDTHVEQQKKTQELKQVLIKGVSDNPGVYLGQVIKIKEASGSQGSYRITKVMHTATENGNYINRFEGVTADIDVYPNTNTMAFPKSGSQVAIVTENSDPDGLSRIKVQFPWQRPDGETTPWLRMITPHSGGEKGFHFIPEIGEEVLVGFEGGNAERPYVMGALYNGGKNAQNWQSQNNDVKAIRTRSGHTIELNDSKGAEFITITDKNRNVVHIDTANNDITISAGENMTLNAKNMQINVEENLDISVGKNKSESITGDSFISATNEDKQIGETIKVISSDYKQEAQEISTDASGEIKTNAGGKITIASAETVEYGE